MSPPADPPTTLAEAPADSAVRERQTVTSPPPNVPIGIDDFRTLREAALVYVDKTHLIRELLDAPGDQVVLLLRPRRFGKSLNLSMLRYYFEKRDDDFSHLFSDLSIWQAGEPYRAHFQRYPVIYLTLKGTRAESFDECWSNIRRKIADLFNMDFALRSPSGRPPLQISQSFPLLRSWFRMQHKYGVAERLENTPPPSPKRSLLARASFAGRKFRPGSHV
jgi:hypothetical protein